MSIFVLLAHFSLTKCHSLFLLVRIRIPVSEIFHISVGSFYDKIPRYVRCCFNNISVFIQCLQSHALFIMTKFLSQDIRVTSSMIAYFDRFEPLKLNKAINRCIRISFLFWPIQLSPKITKFFNVWRNYVDVVIVIEI